MKWYKNDSRAASVRIRSVEFSNSARSPGHLGVPHLLLDRANNTTARWLSISPILRLRGSCMPNSKRRRDALPCARRQEGGHVSGLKEDLYTDIRTRPGFEHALTRTSGSSVSKRGTRMSSSCTTPRTTGAGAPWPCTVRRHRRQVIHMIRNIILLMSFVLLAFSLMILPCCSRSPGVKLVDELASISAQGRAASSARATS